MNELLRTLEPLIVAEARRTRLFVGSSNDQEDVRQHLRMFAVQHAADFEAASDSLRRTMLRFAALNRLRREQRQPTNARPKRDRTPQTGSGEYEAVGMDRAPLSDPTPSSEDFIHTREALDRMMIALSDLTEKELAAFEGLVDHHTAEETGKKLGTSAEAVRQLRVSLTKKLKQMVLQTQVMEASHEDIDRLLAILGDVG